MSIATRRCCCSLFLVAILASIAMGRASECRAQAVPQIVNGAPELAEPTTGALVQGDPDTGFAICSVTLVGCDSAITTAHCFNLSADEKNLVFFQHAGFVEIESATRHPAYVAGYPPNPLNTDALRVEDVAFIKFTTPVTGITPSTIVQIAPPALGTAGKIVGFGRDPITAVSASGIDDNAGIKRSGTMEIEACEGSLLGEDVLCWHPPDPPSPLGPPGEDVSTCEGDSGGPLFVTEGGGRVVAGITKGAVFISSGQSDLCEPPVDPYDTNLDRHRNWIQGAGGAGGMVATTGAIPHTQKSCSPIAQLSELAQSGDAFGDCDGSPWNGPAPPRTCGFTGFLEALGTDTAMHSFPVPSGTTRLRVAFNGIALPSLAVDTDYYLRASSPPTTSQYDCASTGGGTLGYCEFFDPTADTWYTLVDHTLYQGEYQVTITLFGPEVPPPPAVPALGGTWRMLLIGSMTLLIPIALQFGTRSRSKGETRSARGRCSSELARSDRWVDHHRKLLSRVCFRGSDRPDSA